IYMISAYLTAIFLAVLAYFGLESVFFSSLITFFGVIAITGLYGYTVERLAYKPLRGSTRLAPLISAIGMSLILQNYVQINQGSRNQGVPTLIHGALRFGTEERFFQITY